MTPTRLPRNLAPLAARGTAPMLIAVSVYTVAAAGLLWWFDGLPTAVRIPIALPILIVTPGYAVVAALFPASEEAMHASNTESPASRQPSGTGLSALERGVLTVATSIAIVPLVALGVASVAGVALGPVLAGVAATTVVASGIAIVRAPPTKAIVAHRSPGRSDTGFDSLGSIRDSIVTDRITQLAIALTALLLVMSGAVAFTGPTGDSTATEFYLVNETGAASDPAGSSSAGTGDSASEVFDLRIAHHGTESQRYTVVVLTGRHGGSASQDGAQSWTELRRSSTVVQSNETAAVTYRVAEADLSPNSTVRFLLYREGASQSPEPETAHRVLKLAVNVTDE